MLSRLRVRWRLFLLPLAVGLLLTPAAAPQSPRPKSGPPPRPEAVAETRLLMEGINQANFAGLERLLKQKPADVESWAFARGQALLIAECGNLLLLRPPNNQGETAWLERSRDLREAATTLARAAGKRDYDGCVTGMTDVANACTRCHQTFRVQVRVVPFTDPERKP
jgi:hypothetical protein